jgi:hypothetical protein
MVFYDASWIMPLNSEYSHLNRKGRSAILWTIILFRIEVSNSSSDKTECQMSMRETDRQLILCFVLYVTTAKVLFYGMRRDEMIPTTK